MLKTKAKDGAAFWVEATVAPVKNEQGKIVKYSVMLYHFTDETIASLMFERQEKRFGLQAQDPRSAKKGPRNGHARMKVA